MVTITEVVGGYGLISGGVEIILGAAAGVR